jgi:hypothetical protein
MIRNTLSTQQIRPIYPSLWAQNARPAVGASSAFQTRRQSCFQCAAFVDRVAGRAFVTLGEFPWAGVAAPASFTALETGVWGFGSVSKDDAGVGAFFDAKTIGVAAGAELAGNGDEVAAAVDCVPEFAALAELGFNCVCHCERRNNRMCV